jgi:transcription elongation factor Elf1
LEQAVKGTYYLCPVCGFDKLKEPPYNKAKEPSYEICPCCGFEFGFDGVNSPTIFADFRRDWIENGAFWFMLKSKPKDWDLKKQLKNIGKAIK